jgi:hypothetical protein
MHQEIIHHVAYHTPFGAIVDINGKTNPKTGRYYLPQDAIDAGHKSIFVRNGIYPAMGTISAGSFLLMGEGRDTLIDGDTTGAGTFNGSYNVVCNLAFTNSSGGGAGGDAALPWVCSDSILQGCWILDSDSFGLHLVGDRNRIIGNTVEDADEIGMRIQGDNMQVNNNYIKAVGGNAIEILAGSDNCVCVGNITDTAIVDTAATSTVTGNEQY